MDYICKYIYNEGKNGGNIKFYTLDYKVVEGHSFILEKECKFIKRQLNNKRKRKEFNELILKLNCDSRLINILLKRIYGSIEKLKEEKLNNDELIDLFLLINELGIKNKSEIILEISILFN